jgi:hypothetical protein
MVSFEISKIKKTESAVLNEQVDFIEMQQNDWRK